jgi:transposase-like protein
MIRPERERLLGTVEVDETYIGGEEQGSRGRKIVNTALVVIAVEVEDQKLGRVRFRPIQDASANSLVSFVKDNIMPGSLVVTDGWRGYAKLKNQDYQHVVRNIAPSEKDASELLPHVHLIASLVKRWLMGTHQGAVTTKHLSYYLDVYAFRFNRRLSTHRGKLFYRLMQQAVTTEPVPHHKIVADHDF